MYSDLNSRCRKNEEDCRTKADEDVLELVQRYELQLIYSEDKEAYTWSNARYRTYIDFFLTRHVASEEFDFLPAIGNSDHRALTLTVTDAAALRITRTMQLNTKLARLLVPHYRQAIMQYGVDPQGAAEALADLKAQVCRPKKVKLRSFFQALEFSNEESKDTKLKQIKVKEHNRSRFRKLLSELEQNRTTEAKLFFRSVGSLLNLYDIDPSVNVLVDPKNPDRIITDKEEINQLVAEHFRVHFSDEARTLPDPRQLKTNFVVGTEEIRAIMHSIKTEKAIGWSTIPRSLGAPGNAQLVEAVRMLMEDIINSGHFPEIFNCTRLAVLNKTPAQTPTLKSLRPLQIADVTRVYLECLAQPELHILANSDRVSGLEQFGFREHKGTNVCILRLADKWISRRATASASKHCPTRHYLLFIDWRSAFDRVDHDRLLELLAQLKVSERTLRILRIFLHTSNFSTDGRTLQPIKRGCPQGSVISPLLFIIYFGTLLQRLKEIIPSENICAFADDLVVLANGATQLEQLVATISEWAVLNKCELNRDKSKIVEIRKTLYRYPEGENLQGFEIVPHYKYLGILLDASLNMRAQAERLKEKVTKIINYTYKFHLSECSI